MIELVEARLHLGHRARPQAEGDVAFGHTWRKRHVRAKAPNPPTGDSPSDPREAERSEQSGARRRERPERVTKTGPALALFRLGSGNKFPGRARGNTTAILLSHSPRQRYDRGKAPFLSLKKCQRGKINNDCSRHPVQSLRAFQAAVPELSAARTGINTSRCEPPLRPSISDALAVCKQYVLHLHGVHSFKLSLPRINGRTVIKAGGWGGVGGFWGFGLFPN